MNITTIKDIHLGSGLIGIGKKWGYIDSPIPEEQDVLHFLTSAVDLGIFYFDTAASYGTSEERLGKFLKSISSEKRDKLIIATKFGDHWERAKNEAYVDHSFNALKQSLDNSIKLLKKIDLLYLHKANMQALQNNDVAKAFEYANSQGIKYFGASVSDLEAAEYVLNSDFYSILQLPYNIVNTTFETIIKKATRKGKIVVINRPFNMGKMLSETKSSNKKVPFQFILKTKFNGFILTGTKSIKHLEENYQAFMRVKNQHSF